MYNDYDTMQWFYDNEFIRTKNDGDL